VKRLFSIVTLLIATGFATTGERVDASIVKKEIAVDGLEMRIEYPAETAVGKPIEVKIELLNSSGESVKYYFYSKYGLYRFKLVDSNLKSVNLTRFGNDQYNYEGSGVILKLDHKKSETMKLNLARVFDLTEPGTYSFTVSTGFQRGAKLIDLKIDKLSFRIIDEPR
jgi:hypothetical protein